MEENRRNYFRIKDTLGLLVLKAGSELNTQVDNRFSISHELDGIEKESQALLRNLPSEQKELAHLFRLMNKKIDLLAKALVSESSDAKQLVQQDVCLSEASIDFESEQSFTEGEDVIIKLMLLPDYVGLDLTGRIKESHSQSQKTVIEFTDLDEYDRQILARHIIQAQSAERRIHQDDSEQTDQEQG